MTRVQPRTRRSRIAATPDHGNEPRSGAHPSGRPHPSADGGHDRRETVGPFYDYASRRALDAGTGKGGDAVAVELIPGEYVIELENGGVTQPLKEKLVVDRTPFERGFLMPGFSADRAVTTLLGPER